MARYLAGEPAESEVLTDCDRFNEYLLTRLRPADGIGLDEAVRRFGPERIARLLQAAETALQAGNLRQAEGRLAIPAERFLRSDAVIGALFEVDGAE